MPLNLAASRARGAAVYDENRAYLLRQSAYFRTDIRFSYRREMRRSTMEFSMDLQNVTAGKNVFRQTYNPRTNEVVNQYQQMACLVATDGRQYLVDFKLEELESR